MAEAAAEMGAYSEAYRTAQADGGARESILAILHASDPPGLSDGTFQRMSFGLDHLLEATGNGRQKWMEIMKAGEMGGPQIGGSIIESLFIFSSPAAALEALGISGTDIMAFRQAAHAHARTVDDSAAEVASRWMIREMLRYWGWLPFLEAAAAAAEPLPPPRPDGSSLTLTGSAPTTDAPFTPPSGSSTRPPRFICGLRPSSGGAANIPAPASLTEPASPPPAPTASARSLPPREPLWRGEVPKNRPPVDPDDRPPQPGRRNG